ncbi:MAG: hypothetical protein ACREUF_11530 [Solimonas sp.]
MDAELTALAGLGSAADRLPYFTGAGTAALTTLTSYIRGYLAAVDAAAARGTLGLSSSAIGDASGLTTGTVDPARLPVLPSSVQIVSSGAIADLTTAQQNEIGDGSIVTTTDGRRWVYTGSGSKTAEASYIELADITPEWAVISNKPANVTSLAGLTLAADKGLYATAANTLATFDLTAAGRALMDDASASAQRTTLGVGTGNTPTFAGVTFADAGNLAVGTTTGSKIGTATTQKLGFWNAAPIVQPTRAGALTDNSGGTSGGDTIANVAAAAVDTSAAQRTATQNAIATLAARVNSIEAKLSAAAGGCGITA